jgi:hypothetical protein
MTFRAELARSSFWPLNDLHLCRIYTELLIKNTFDLVMFLLTMPLLSPGFITRPGLWYPTWRRDDVSVARASLLQWRIGNIQRGPKVTSLVARQVRATFAWCTRATWRTSYANFARNICVTYAPDSRRMRASHPRIRRKCCAHLLREERATRDVTFGPFCTM